MADSTWTIPIDGNKQAIGPFPFTVRKVTIQNRCTAGNVWAVDDKGAQYEATPLTAVESKANDTVYLTVYIDAPQAVGSAAIIVSSEEPVLDISTSQLSTQAQAASSVIVPTVALASFPPAAPVDGQITSIVLPASYDPVGNKTVRWLATFDAALGMWAIAGPPLYAEVLTGETPASNAAYGDMATVGPSLPLPRPGDYVVGVGFQPNGINQTFFMSPSFNGSVPSDNDAAEAGNTAFYSVARRREQTGLLAGTVKAQYKGGAGSGQTLGKRWLEIIPIRIS